MKAVDRMDTAECEQAIRDINDKIEALCEQKRAISARHTEVLEAERDAALLESTPQAVKDALARASRASVGVEGKTNGG